MAKLYFEVNRQSGRLMMMSPLVFQPTRLPNAEEAEAIHTQMVAMLTEYLRCHGRVVSPEELAGLLEDKIPEGILEVQKGLARLCYYQNQPAILQPQTHHSAHNETKP